jgi:hypothetical protein
MIAITKRRERELMKMAKENPLWTLRTCQAELSTAHVDLRKTQEKLVTVGYACAYEMETDWKKWVEFVKDPFWSKRKKKPKKERDARRKLLLSMKYVFGAIDQIGDKRAWYYFVTLEKYFNARVKPEELTARIEADGGMAKVYRDATTMRSSARQAREAEKAKIHEGWDFDLGPADSETSEDDSELDTDGDPLDDDDDFDFLADKPTKAAAAKTSTKKSIEFIVPEEMTHELLGLSMGKRIKVALKRVEDESRSVRLQVLPALTPERAAEEARLKRARARRREERARKRGERAKSASAQKPQRKHTWATANPGKN